MGHAVSGCSIEHASSNKQLAKFSETLPETYHSKPTLTEPQPTSIEHERELVVLTAMRGCEFLRSSISEPMETEANIAPPRPEQSSHPNNDQGLLTEESTTHE